MASAADSRGIIVEACGAERRRQRDETMQVAEAGGAVVRYLNLLDFDVDPCSLNAASSRSLVHPVA